MLGQGEVMGERVLPHAIHGEGCIVRCEGLWGRKGTRTPFPPQGV